MIELAGVTKRFAGKGGVDGVSFALAPGELLTLFGPSGCGKTTILRLVAGLAVPDAGAVRFDGRDMLGVPAPQRHAPMVFQDHLLFPHLTVAGNVAFGLTLRGDPAAARKAAEALAAVQLSAYAGRWPAELSGGQKQRVALSRALVLAPRVLLLDEPFSALDAALRAEMRDLLRTLRRTTPVSTLLVTHDADEAFELSDRVAVLLDGRIRQLGTPAEIDAAPRDQAVAAALGYRTQLRGTAADGRFHVDGASLPLAERWRGWNGPALALLRPDALYVSVGGELAATVDEPRFRRALVRLPSGLRAEAAASGALAPGESVRLAWNPASVSLLSP